MSKSALADKLGSIRAKIEELKAQEEEVRQQILEQESGELVGFKYVASICVSERQTIDWKSVAQKLKPSTQLVTAHTRYATIQTVRVAEKR